MIYMGELSDRRGFNGSQASVAFAYFAYSFVKIYRTGRVTPATAAGVTDGL
jgi:hypothetical protein